MNPNRTKLFWSLTYLSMAVFCTVFFVIPITQPERHWWLPLDISTFGGEIDSLFNLILFITSVAFFGVQALLVWFVYKYGEGDKPRKGIFIHGNHTLEVWWTAIPAAILVFIAVYQMSTWKKIKFPSAFPERLRARIDKKQPFAEVTGRQFEWRITYPGRDAEGNELPLGQRSDVHVLGNFHVPRGEPILINLRSLDVLHSFYLPNFRLKQDAVPGMTIPVWFEAKPNAQAGTYDLICAELCGWGHYKMKGQLTVHETRADFEEWLKKAKTAEEAAE